MKLVYLFIIKMFFGTMLFGQTFYSRYNTGSVQKIVKIELDTSYQNVDFITASKTFGLESEIVNEINSNEITLVGDFQFLNGNIVLNYSDFNYYLIPINPSEPFYLFPQSGEQTVSNSVIYINDHSSYHAATNSDDGWFFCHCGGGFPPPSEPGGCVSSKQGTKITCWQDGECNSFCIGLWVVLGHHFNGGGILIQVNKNKNTLYQNFATGN